MSLTLTTAPSRRLHSKLGGWLAAGLGTLMGGTGTVHIFGLPPTFPPPAGHLRRQSRPSMIIAALPTHQTPHAGGATGRFAASGSCGPSAPPLGACTSPRRPHLPRPQPAPPARFYAESFPASGSKDAALLDICSSWISHYPDGYTAGRVAGGWVRGDWWVGAGREISVRGGRGGQCGQSCGTRCFSC